MQKKSSIVACFQVLEDLQYIKKLNRAELYRVVASKIRFEGSERLFRGDYNPTDYDNFKQDFSFPQKTPARIFHYYKKKKIRKFFIVEFLGLDDDDEDDIVAADLDMHQLISSEQPKQVNSTNIYCQMLCCKKYVSHHL